MKRGLWITAIAALTVVPVLASPVGASSEISLVQALQAARNSVKVAEAKSAVTGAQDSLLTLTESERLNWQVDSPTFTTDSTGFAEKGSWALIGKSGGVDTITAQAFPDELSITWTRNLLPNPALGHRHTEESLKHNLRSAQLHLSDQLYQALLDTYNGYLATQLDWAELGLGQKQAGLAKESFERESALFALGETTETAVTRAKAEWLRAEAIFARDQAVVAKDTVLFLAALDLPGDAVVEPIRLADLRSQAIAAVDSKAELKYSVEQALSSSTELSLLDSLVHLKEIAVTQARAATPWSVGVSATGSTDLDTREGQWQLGAGATFDLSGGAARRRDLAQAENELVLARRRRAEAENRLRQEYQAAVTTLGYQRSLVQAALWEWEASQTEYEVAQAQRRVGVITERDLARVQLAVEQAELSLARAYLAFEVQKHTLMALHGEEPLLALVKGEGADES